MMIGEIWQGVQQIVVVRASDGTKQGHRHSNSSEHVYFHIWSTTNNTYDLIHQLNAIPSSRIYRRV